MRLIEKQKRILRDMVSVLKPDNKNRLQTFLFIISHPKRVFNALTGKELFIRYADLVVTSVCTLRCEGCGALMSMYRKPVHFNKEAIINSLCDLRRGGVHINRIHVLGGEPLCYPFLYDILYYLRDLDNVNEIGITTNGTLTLKDKRLIDLLCNPKFRIEISYYGETVSKKMSELTSLLKNNGIRYLIRDNMSWVDFGDFANRGRDENVLKHMYSQCVFKYTNCILQEKLYHCSREAHGTYLGLLPSSEKNYVDLSLHTTLLRKELLRFLYGNVASLETCNYCDMTNSPKYIKAGVQP